MAKGAVQDLTLRYENLEPRVDFRFHEVPMMGKRIVLMTIDRAAVLQPVRFAGSAFIRIGSHKKRLDTYPEKERTLWRVFERSTFETGVAREYVSDEQVLALLDYPSYFELLKRPLPDGNRSIIAVLEQDSLIEKGRTGAWDITNLGALLFGKRLSDFGLGRKAMRVIVYRGNDRLQIERTLEFDKGYAAGFEFLISSINNTLPSAEVIGNALRKTVTMYPPLAVRELVVNTLIHQDFTATGSGPMVEVFGNRIEFTNPGQPLVATDRLLDSPPKSRNDAIGAMMRRMRICEEAGSGIDKVVWQVEYYQLPAPLFEAPGDFTRAMLFAHRPLTKMDKIDRVRACYLHACLKYVSGDYLTNSSLRERFGITEKSAPLASKYIREALEAGQIVLFDEAASPKHRKYMPWWARLLSR